MEHLDDLIAILENVARGDYSPDVLEFTRPDHSPHFQRIAEAMGMMMVKVEAREMALAEKIEELKRTNETIRQHVRQTIKAIAAALGARDRYSQGHIVRVAGYSERLARRLRLPEEDVAHVRLGGWLHDIGKIGFSDEVFHNEDTVPSEALLQEIRQHPRIGYEILQELGFLGPALDYVLFHHERVDGSGYPIGLRGDEIPLGARIVAVADAFDAMTTDRFYRKARPVETVLGILREFAGQTWDIACVEAMEQEIEAAGIEHFAPPSPAP